MWFEYYAYYWVEVCFVVVLYGGGFLLCLFGVNVLFAHVLRVVLGSERYEAFTHSPASAASVGVSYHGLRFVNAAILAGFGLIATVLFPGNAKVFAVLSGIGIAAFTGYFLGGAIVAVVLGWFLA